MKIIRTNSLNSDFQSLILELDKDLWSRNSDVQQTYDRFNKIENIDTVVVAYDLEEPVGCGCYKPFDDGTIEIKRMFVRKEHRGKGISKQILLELEKWASENHYDSSILETGHNQHEAIGLYNRLGYHKIDNFGQYANMPNSICFRKHI